MHGPTEEPGGEGHITSRVRGTIIDRSYDTLVLLEYFGIGRRVRGAGGGDEIGQIFGAGGTMSLTGVGQAIGEVRLYEALDIASLAEYYSI